MTHAQVACFANVARHLDPGGRFVIEVGIPDLQRLPPGETVRPFAVSESHVGFDEYDLPVQGLVSHHYWLRAGDAEYRPVPFRYVWPSELGLDGAPRRYGVGGALERLGSGAIHRRQSQPRLCLGDRCVG